MKTFRSVVLFLVAAGLGVCQDMARPDQWHGLTLDESTPEQAVQTLGNPAADRVEAIAISPISRWFRPDLKKKAWRCLFFREVEGFGRVDLYFDADKLVIVQLRVKTKILPSALANIYGLEFSPMMTGLQESMSSVERHKGRAYPKNYPSLYNVVAIAPTSVVNAYVRNDGWGAVLHQAIGSGIDTAGGGFPGQVAAIQLISRRLEDHTGADALK